MHFIKPGCMLGQKIKNGIKYMHSDFQFLKKFLAFIGLFQVTVGYAVAFVFIMTAKAYPLITTALVCFGKNGTFNDYNGTVNGTMGEAFAVPGVGCGVKFAALNTYTLIVIGFGLHYVAYVETFYKAKFWLFCFVFQCIPSVMALLAAVRFLLGHYGKDQGQDDGTETGIEGCQIFITAMLLLWSIFNAYVAFVVCCFMNKLKPKPLRRAVGLIEGSQSQLI